jgi:glyoxylate/hydroxypyruvate reductase A
VPSSERTVGILGLGHLGRVAAQKLVEQGFRVLGWSRSETVLPDVHTFAGEDGLETLLIQSQILVVLLPLTSQTHHLLNADRLGKLPQNASVINFARGAIIDEDGLIKCLESGALSHAVLDVFKKEPLSPGSCLWDHPSVTVLPHISAPTSLKSASSIVAQNIELFFDKGVLPKFVERAKGY